MATLRIALSFSGPCYLHMPSLPVTGISGARGDAIGSDKPTSRVCFTSQRLTNRQCVDSRWRPTPEKVPTRVPLPGRGSSHRAVKGQNIQ